MRRLALSIFVAFFATPASALDIVIKEMRTPASVVTANIEVRDVLPDRFKKLLEAGGVLHLRVEAELWESRPVWDRLVYPAIVRMFRLGNTAGGRDVAIIDPDGASKTYPSIPATMPVVLDLGDRSRLTVTEKHYVHGIATLGTLAER